MKKVKIGIICEDPNDFKSFAHYFKKWPNMTLVKLVHNQTGSKLENPRTPKVAAYQAQKLNVDAVVFIKDMDSLYSNKARLTFINSVFERYSSACTPLKTFMILNVYEAEAIAFSDPNALEKVYKIRIKERNPCMIEKPKEELIRLTSKSKSPYSESEMPKLFKYIDFNIASKKCFFLKNFEEEFKF